MKLTGAKSFIIQYRNARGRSRRLTLGRYGVLTVDEARRKARLSLASVLKGEDPAESRLLERGALTVADLCREYLAKAERGLESSRSAAIPKRRPPSTPTGFVSNATLFRSSESAPSKTSQPLTFVSSYKMSSPVKRLATCKPQSAGAQSFAVALGPRRARRACWEASSPTPCMRDTGRIIPQRGWCVQRTRPANGGSKMPAIASWAGVLTTPVTKAANGSRSWLCALQHLRVAAFER